MAQRIPRGRALLSSLDLTRLLRVYGPQVAAEVLHHLLRVKRGLRKRAAS